jgi:uncharacterized protein YegL
VIYLLLDVSNTMREVPSGEVESPFDRFQLLMPELVLSMREHIQVRTTCWLSVIAFATKADTVLPAVTLRQIPAVPPLPPGGQTDYVAALKLLHERIPIDQAEIARSVTADAEAEIVVRPLVFFITDGYPYVGQTRQPRSEWLAARNKVVANGFGSNIAAIGLRGADEAVLAELATGDGGSVNAFVADGSVPATKLAGNIINAIMDSVARSAEAGTMVIETPPGMRRVAKQ